MFLDLVALSHRLPADLMGRRTHDALRLQVLALSGTDASDQPLGGLAERGGDAIGVIEAVEIVGQAVWARLVGGIDGCSLPMW